MLPFIEAMAAIPAPVYAVSGNHDHWTDWPYIAGQLAEAGVTVLDNEHRALKRGAAEVVLAGVSDPYTGHDDLGKALIDVDGPGVTGWGPGGAMPGVRFTSGPAAPPPRSTVFSTARHAPCGGCGINWPLAWPQREGSCAGWGGSRRQIVFSTCCGEKYDASNLFPGGPGSAGSPVSASPCISTSATSPPC